MINIKVKNGKAEIEVEGKTTHIVAELSEAVKAVYEQLKQHDKVGAVQLEVYLMEMITGEEFDNARLKEYLDIQKTISPEDVEKMKRMMKEGTE